ncbi:hypothetical protein EI290_03105 [Hymenobacter metallilatus]|uniref:Resolvase HTH domain-containing protein n=2 Tax=Hymenobacter metallilatus TaxID=2493666 RepID=A0A428JU35_9BACT|nr:hypothetical protein EI290_03105 [Hymenobacter metallilatus]
MCHYSVVIYRTQLLLFNTSVYLHIHPTVTLVTMPHQGEILQEAIKNSGISITRIVDELGITRPTIYRKFKDDTLDYGFVKRVGEIIGHDFSQDFTSLQQSVLPFVNNTITQGVTNSVTNTGVKPMLQRGVTPQPIETDVNKQLMLLQQKYIALLEAYNELLLKVYGPR